MGNGDVMEVVNASIDCQPIGQREGPPGEQGRDADQRVWGDSYMPCRAERSWRWNEGDSNVGDHLLPALARLYSRAIVSPACPQAPRTDTLLLSPTSAHAISSLGRFPSVQWGACPE